MKPSNADFAKFDQVLAWTRAYFFIGRPDDLDAAGTREQVARYVRRKVGDVPELMVSAALQRLREDSVILFDKRVWWGLSDK